MIGRITLALVAAVLMSGAVVLAMGCSGLVPNAASGDAPQLQVSEDNGTNFKFTSYRWQLNYWNQSSDSSSMNIQPDGGTAISAIQMGNAGVNSAPGITLDTYMDNLSDTTTKKMFKLHSHNYDGTNFWYADGAGFYNGDNGAINAFHITMAPGGGIKSGTCTLWGWNS
jgi:hypothetical protein